MFPELRNRDPKSIPSNVLAYIGDCVFELYSRLYVIDRSDGRINDLHRRNIAIVNAGAQATAARRILENLSEDEQMIFRRGRNASSGAMAKNAHAADYRVATGIETLIGYLFMTDAQERLKEVLELLFAEIPAER